MDGAQLPDVRVVVAGAGLAGLAAARALERAGADVIVIEARDRVGGRVHTLRGDFFGGEHAEAGADLIEGGQSLVRELARELKLKTARVLRDGFGYYGGAGREKRIRKGPAALREAARLLKEEIDDYRLADERWDSAIAASLARQSVAAWLDRIGASRALRAGMRGLRGFFLADPEDLSLLALVDQFASGGVPGDDALYRIRGGNDRLPRAMAAALRGRSSLATVLRRVHQNEQGLTVTVEERGTRHELRADYLVAALPASTLRDVVFQPRLPVRQATAIRTLRYGRATRLVLQYERAFWRKARRPRAFGTDLPIGAVWDAAEEQHGRPAILTFLAGGAASGELQDLLERDGPEGVTRELAWLGRAVPLMNWHRVAWEDDRWARGGYACFDPSFDPELRAWLARPAGRVVFAGEHTSLRWQGYMNGAIESGRRAAAEIRALASRTPV